jgi:transcriptional regulator with XRE-family HTH domain
MSRFGEILKKYRENAQMSTSELAEKSGISEYNITAFEDIGRSPEINELMSLSDALGIKSVELL